MSIDLRRRRPTRIPVRSECLAPSVEMHLSTDGTVRACCIAGDPLGKLPEDRIGAIWRGHRRAEMVGSLAAGEFPRGCGGCRAEIEIEGRDAAYPRIFDERAGHLDGTPGRDAWPSWIEFNLSNSCNLQCVQCDGELSSSIRLHRERRAPMPRAYGDEFFDDIVEFLPHLSVAQFAGGEPFLAPENFRMWELIAQHAPHVLCLVITNGTQFGARVQRALEQVRMGFTLSLDGITKATFESIRVGADFATVMTNAEHLHAHAIASGTPFTINHCLMPQNHHEFADLLLWAEERGVLVNVSVVRGPARYAIGALPPDEITAVHRRLLDMEERVQELELNRSTWRQEVDRIGRWAATPRDQMLDAWAGSRYAEVLGLSGLGSGPHDDTAARERLRRFAGDGVVHVVTTGSDDRIRSVSAGLPSFLGVPDDHLSGAHIDALRAAVTDRFGIMQQYEVVRSTPDQIDAHVGFADVEVNISMVAMRDAAGRADEGRLLIAARPAGSG